MSDVQMFCGVAYPGCVIVPITEVFSGIEQRSRELSSGGKMLQKMEYRNKTLKGKL